MIANQFQLHFIPPLSVLVVCLRAMYLFCAPLCGIKRQNENIKCIHVFAYNNDTICGKKNADGASEEKWPTASGPATEAIHRIYLLFIYICTQIE